MNWPGAAAGPVTRPGPLPARDLLRGPTRGAPARGGHPAAGAGGDHGDRPGGVHHRAAGGGTLGDGGGAAGGVMEVSANG
ncbi:hypothetical protein G6F46_014673 [Rhizopus delemar]|nr:hypothetical protein G6F46_014673 [Rhizopus delemar]